MGEVNGAIKHGGWTDEAVALRITARGFAQAVRKGDPVNIDELIVKRERRLAGEDLPYTREEAQVLIAYARKTIKEKAGTRARRKAANKAAWAAGDRSPWGA